MTSIVQTNDAPSIPFQPQEILQRGKKRKWGAHEVVEQLPQKNRKITAEFIKKCRVEFSNDQKNIITRNAIVTVGTVLAATNSEEVNKVNHVFLNTLKAEHVKATNQGHSGRCWMFAGLNMFRHILIKGLGLKNFEFSETHLFFWDKIERSNQFLTYILDNLETPLNDRTMESILNSPVQDGGYWTTFVNLVNKYGLIPKDAMKETFHSSDSGEINDVINLRLRGCAYHLKKNRNKLTAEQLEEVRSACIQQIYDIMVKFLGMPPEKFDWSYLTTDYFERQTVTDLTPITFKSMALGGIDLNDFVTLTNFPDHTYNKLYELKYSSNITGGNECRMLNVPIQELKKYSVKAITSGLPVWVGADVMKGFHPYEDTLNEKLIDYDLVFGKSYHMDKSQRLNYRDAAATHAMCLTGVDFDHKGKPIKWQVENSWGYYDDETPGMDGFLTMSDEWFDENVYEVVVHKNQLSRTLQGMLTTDVVQVEPWDTLNKAAMSK